MNFQYLISINVTIYLTMMFGKKFYLDPTVQQLKKIQETLFVIQNQIINLTPSSEQLYHVQFQKQYIYIYDIYNDFIYIKSKKSKR